MTEGSDNITEVQPVPTAPVSVDDATGQLDVPRRAFSASQIALVFVSVALAAFLAGIGIGVATRMRSDEAVVASKVIGRDGGIVRFDRGHLDFPPRALGRNTRIVVYRSTFDDRVTVKGAEIDAQRFDPGDLVAYRFAPDDVRFRRPVGIVFRLDEGSRNAALFARRDESVILLSGRVDTARQVAVTEVRDFRFRELER